MRGSLFCNHRELYHDHQYKFAFVKLFYLFDLFRTKNLVALQSYLLIYNFKTIIYLLNTIVLFLTFNKLRI